jgi:hypothetical protein
MSWLETLASGVEAAVLQFFAPKGGFLVHQATGAL